MNEINAVNLFESLDHLVAQEEHGLESEIPVTEIK
jgi:hypothetical protein